MSRSGIAGLLGVALAVAFATPAAHAQGTGKSAPTGVSQYAAKFDVSKAEAERVIELQTRGVDVAQAAKEQLGDRFGGYWFDNEAKRYVIGDTGPSTEASVQASRAASAAGVSAGEDVAVKHVKYSQAHLDDVIKRVETWHRGLDRKRDVLFSLVPPENAVVVQTPEGLDPKIRAEILDDLPQDGAIRVETASRSRFNVPATDYCADWNVHTYCSDPLRGGVRILKNGNANQYCSAGFLAVTTTQVVLMTAGHCVSDGNNTWYSHDGWTGGFYYIGVGGGPYTWFFGGGGPGDAGIVTTGGTWWAGMGYRRAVVDWNNNWQLLINGKADPAWGETICKSGTASGTTCGQVTSLSASWTPKNYPGEIMYGLTVTNACTSPGDSGGPQFVGDIAKGITNGGSCGGEDGYVSILTKISTIESQLGAYVVTGPWPGFY